MKIVLLFSHEASVRERLLMIEGLLEHMDIEPEFNLDEFIEGKPLVQKSKNIFKVLLQCDYILQFEEIHFHDKQIIKFIKDNDLYYKMIYLDFQDSQKMDKFYLENSFLYFKRSWPRDCLSKGHPENLKNKKIYPLTYGVLNSYYDRLLYPDVECNINISYMFNKNAPGRRGKVYRLLEKFNIDNIYLNPTTINGNIGRKSITKDYKENVWLEYMKILKRSKIVFTVFPEKWDGDSRCWEAFASGAMVFMDRPVLPFKNRLKHLKHCYIFDASSEGSTIKAIEDAMYYLAKDKKRKKIAQRGYSFIIKHHRGIARVNEIYRIIKKIRGSAYF